MASEATAATGSAHYQPTVAFKTGPTSKIADRYAHISVCFASATSAPLESNSAMRRLERANKGMTTSEAKARIGRVIAKTGSQT